MPSATRRRAPSRQIPNAMFIRVPGMKASETEALAVASAQTARALAPKSSGTGAMGIAPYFGPGFYGVMWDRDYMWFQETGVRGFTMRSLAGKVIPMWVDDPTGAETRKIPLDKRSERTRVTVLGRRQVLIFRRAARIGQRKNKAVHHRDGTITYRSVPASYPGAPGRIARRQVVDGRHTGRIAKITHPATPHKGVRWHFPGLVGRHFMSHSLTLVGSRYGIATRSVETVHVGG